MISEQIVLNIRKVIRYGYTIHTDVGEEVLNFKEIGKGRTK